MRGLLQRILKWRAVPAVPNPEEVERTRARLAAEHDALFAGIRATRPERQASRERGWATRRAERRKADPLLPLRDQLMGNRR